MLLERSVENKKIIWFSESNRYSLLEIPAYEIIVKLNQNISPEEIVLWCSTQYEIPETEARRFVNEVHLLLEQQSSVSENATDLKFLESDESIAIPVFSFRFYKIRHQVFSVEFGDEETELLIHPKIAHLEISASATANYYFQVYQTDDNFVLKVDGKIIGEWIYDDAHYFSGKFTMELLNRMYQRSEAEWMGVFHASAISYGNSCVLFLGDSGNGKSTISAILMSSGFDLVVDDFVPVDAEKGEVFYFPAAVSIKKKALDYLMPMYPQLEHAKEFHFPGLNKTVRYLAPPEKPLTASDRFPCKALIFVKYEKDSGMTLEKMPKDVAFQQLVPDSWISPLPENASRFLDWFQKMPCYRLTYSDNEKMVLAIHELFENE